MAEWLYSIICVVIVVGVSGGYVLLPTVVKVREGDV